MEFDHVEKLLMQWRQQCPDLDCSSMAIIGRLSRVNRLISQKRQTGIEGHGLSEIEFDILVTLRLMAHPVTPTELYQTLMVSSGAVSTRIERMVQQDWVERVASQHDRRSYKVRITPAGRTLIDQIIETNLDLEKSFLEPLTEEEQVKISTLLRHWLLSIDATR
ncbi:MarR family transcriptional regulator [Photobacterium galatheae]|uniref:MarR family transcriptional regulator n=2 Tax=Photobacterium galatheae TaxID=1654360 RepID=A0A066RW34_9GAMM|nr:MarR family transcriptional regulator [Photobacterium galatheae]MCM0150430.1 MarR family transcriptional regulator [Photobacterium galatheae]